MLQRILLLSALLFLIDLYFFQAVKTLSADLAAPRKNLVYIGYWTFTALSVVIVGSFILFPNLAIPRFVKYYTMSVVLIFFFSKLLGALFLLIDDLRRLSVWGISAMSPDSGFDPTRKKFLTQVSLVMAAIPFTTLIYGMVRGAFNYQVRRVPLKLKNLPDSFIGTKIVQISDLHTGSFAFNSPLERVVKLIKKEAADIVFFTGDLVNNKAEEAENFRDILKNITAPKGVYSVVGNHDYGDYVPWDSAEAKADNFRRLTNFHKDIGWNLLMNENAIITKGNDKLAILGVENWSASNRFPRYGNLNKAKQGAEGAPVKLLLSHDPSHWEAQVIKEHPDIDVTFSGHTHGFQFGVEIPGFKWSPVQYVYKQWAGLYEQGMQKLYVNRGVGFLGYLGRVGISPEITVFELKKA